MPELRNVNVQQVDERCATCGKGYMRPTGVVKTVQPTLYQHSCTNCGHIQDYTIRYPYTVQ